LDAGKRAAPADAGKAVAATPPDVGAHAGVASGDALTIKSQPAGARVFLNGSDAGVTPLKLPGTPDRHTIALLLPGYELYIAQVDGQGAFSIPLKEVTPMGGPAGIKVIKCKDKDRYYVFVDGKPTGQTCPTERIETGLGAHVVEVYDVVSETRKKFEIEVKDTRLSYRVKVE
ncbi:MAG: PEGA domain-containing protein, partial [Myxococcota bacterium]|nr:PEGA domain-containing protein [Myxococcota bacterium]